MWLSSGGRSENCAKIQILGFHSGAVINIRLSPILIESLMTWLVIDVF